jgi:hypothetical protein
MELSGQLVSYIPTERHCIPRKKALVDPRASLDVWKNRNFFLLSIGR